MSPCRLEPKPVWRLCAALWVAMCLAVAAGLVTTAQAALPTGPQAGLPTGPQAGEATAIAPVPGGGWLLLQPRALVLLDAQGAQRARLALRAEHLDTRPRPGGLLAVVLDADTQRTLAVTVDAAAQTLAMQTLIESPPFSVEAVCLHRDPQGLDHVFLVGSDGRAEQWLLRKAGALRVRSLALPPKTLGCAVDDRTQRLYVNEEDIGVWAYRAQAEGASARSPVALRRPMGDLRGGAAALAVLPDGLAVLEAGAPRLHHLRERDGVWTRRSTVAAAMADDDDQLAVFTDAAGLQVAWRDAGTGAWRGHRFGAAAAATSATTAATVAASTAAASAASLPIVTARAQTDPVARFGDAADDPAIWVHPTLPEQSRVLGTNKKQGLLVYDLQGRQQQLLAVGRVNNVDLRQRVRFASRTLDVAVATQRDDLSVILFLLDAQGQVSEHARIPTGLEDIYGVCLHQPGAGGLEIFVNDKDGRYQRYAVSDHDGRLSGRLTQRFQVASQPEACVADDAQARLFIGEEKRGVWAMALDAPMDAPGNAAPKLQMVMPVGGRLHADVEGLGLYHGQAGQRYLVVSSQGNDSYVVADAQPPYAVRGAFRVGINAQHGIDGASETDGLEVTSQPLGAGYPRGLLVVQDGHKRLPDGPQNFKLIDWADVARALGL